MYVTYQSPPLIATALSEGRSFRSRHKLQPSPIRRLLLFISHCVSLFSSFLVLLTVFLVFIAPHISFPPSCTPHPSVRQCPLRVTSRGPRASCYICCSCALHSALRSWPYRSSHWAYAQPSRTLRRPRRCRRPHRYPAPRRLRQLPPRTHLSSHHRSTLPFWMPCALTLPSLPRPCRVQRAPSSALCARLWLACSTPVTSPLPQIRTSLLPILPCRSLCVRSSPTSHIISRLAFNLRPPLPPLHSHPLPLLSLRPSPRSRHHRRPLNSSQLLRTRRPHHHHRLPARGSRRRSVP